MEILSWRTSNLYVGTSDVSSQRRQQSLPTSTSSELSCSRWIDEPAVEEYNGWGVPEPRKGCRDASAEVHYQGWENTTKDQTESSGLSSCGMMDKTDNASEFRPIVSPVENSETQTLGDNPAFDFAVLPSAPPVPEEVEDIHYPVIDLSPLHLSNPPCGHMVGCMQCLNQIKPKKGECPVCRVKNDQVIKLYSV